MTNLLDQLKAQTAGAEAIKKAEAEVKEAEAENARQEAAKKLTDETRFQRVRTALDISPEKYAALAAQHKAELQEMVPQNRELVGDAATALRNAEAVGIHVSRDQRIGIVKQVTGEGLKKKYNEMRAAEAAGKTSEYLKANFDHLTPEEVASLENADPTKFEEIKNAVGARLEVLKNKDESVVKEGGDAEIIPEASETHKELTSESSKEEVAQELDTLLEEYNQLEGEVYSAETTKSSDRINKFVLSFRDNVLVPKQSSEYKRGEKMFANLSFSERQAKNFNSDIKAYLEGYKAEDQEITKALSDQFENDKTFQEDVKTLLSANQKFLKKTVGLDQRLSACARHKEVDQKQFNGVYSKLTANGTGGVFDGKDPLSAKAPIMLMSLFTRNKPFRDFYQKILSDNKE